MAGRAGVLQAVRAWHRMTADEKRTARRPPTWSFVLLRLACGHHVIRKGSVPPRLSRCGHCEAGVPEVVR